VVKNKLATKEVDLVQRAELMHKVKTIIGEVFGTIEDFADDADLTEKLGADSLDLVELSLEIEDQLDVSIPDRVIEKLKTAADFTDFIMRERQELGKK